jgi:ferredoxin
MRVVPVKESIPAELNVLTFEEVDNLIDESPTVCLTTCICRTNKEIIGEGCNFPKDDICIIFTPWAEYYIEYGLGRKASKEEAKNALRKAEEVGLVHCAMNVQRGGIAICNCCSCCCAILRGITQLKIPTSVAKSNFIVDLLEDDCTGCGDCVERCQVNALELNDSIVSLKKERCIGCGLCVTTCPVEALTLKRRKEEIVPPNDVNNLMVAIQQGREL